MKSCEEIERYLKIANDHKVVFELVLVDLRKQARARDELRKQELQNKELERQKEGTWVCCGKSSSSSRKRFARD